MGTSKEEIRTWLKNAKEGGATHLIVACDTFDGGDFPVPVLHDEQVADKIKEYSNSDKMLRVVEVYAMHLDLESQLNERFAYHTEYPSAFGVADSAFQEARAQREEREAVGSVGPSTHGGPSSLSPVRRSDEVQREGAAGRDRPNLLAEDEESCSARVDVLLPPIERFVLCRR